MDKVKPKDICDIERVRNAVACSRLREKGLVASPEKWQKNHVENEKDVPVLDHRLCRMVKKINRRIASEHNKDIDRILVWITPYSIFRCFLDEVRDALRWKEIELFLCSVVIWLIACVIANPDNMQIQQFIGVTAASIVGMLFVVLGIWLHDAYPGCLYNHFTGAFICCGHKDTHNDDMHKIIEYYRSLGYSVGEHGSGIWISYNNEYLHSISKLEHQSQVDAFETGVPLEDIVA